MIKINHPTLAVSKVVKEAQVESWLAAGWLLDTPAPEPEPATEPAEGSPKPSRRRKAD